MTDEEMVKQLHLIRTELHARIKHRGYFGAAIAMIDQLICYIFVTYKKDPEG